MPTTRDADVILKRFDETQRREGADAATTACERPAMERATRALASRAVARHAGHMRRERGGGVGGAQDVDGGVGTAEGKITRHG